VLLRGGLRRAKFAGGWQEKRRMRADIIQKSSGKITQSMRHFNSREIDDQFVCGNTPTSKSRLVW
jgi:hypothetical protein